MLDNRNAMQAQARPVSGSLFFHGAGVCLFAILLAHWLPDAAYGPAFGALGLFHFVVRICLAGIGDAHESSSKRCLAADIGQVLLRWIATVCLLTAVWGLFGLALFIHHPALPLLAAACALTFALGDVLRSVTASSGAVLGYWALILLASLAAHQAGVAQIEGYVGLQLLAGLIWVGFLAWRRRKSGTKNVHRQSAALTVMAQALRLADILLVCIIFFGPAAAVYLSARAMAALVPMALKLVSHAVGTPLSDRYAARGQGDFRATAARANLGFLLIGGGVMLATLGVGQTLNDHAEFGGAGTHLTFVWLLIAGAAPVVFGATDLLMRIVNAARLRQLIQSAAAVATIAIGVALRVDRPEDVARLFALAHLAADAASALWVMRYMGVWPGITGVLHRQIRLV